ncbi:MAG: hypothetical protein ACRD8O_17175, partial [Bryobacteraceae bacterium]
HLLQVNLDAYRQLKNHIAKAIVPLLQIWSGEAHGAGRLEKGYGELCQILNIASYRYGSKIREKLGPSLDELKTRGYLSDWRIEKAEGSPGYKLVLTTGRGLG